MTQEQELIERRPVECTPENVERCIQGLANWVEHYNDKEQWAGIMPMLLVADAANLLSALRAQLDEAKNQLDSETFTRERREARCRELSAQLDKAREVKPLVWGETEFDVNEYGEKTWGNFFAKEIVSTARNAHYGIYKHGDGRFMWVDGTDFNIRYSTYRPVDDPNWKAEIPWFPTEREAQNGAQSDYQRRYNAMSAQEGE